MDTLPQGHGQATAEAPPPSTIIRPAEITAALGVHPSTTSRLLRTLEAHGLRRKGRGRGTHYSRQDFNRHYDAWDTRDSSSTEGSHGCSERTPTR